eukprot:g46821.t1
MQNLPLLQTMAVDVRASPAGEEPASLISCLRGLQDNLPIQGLHRGQDETCSRFVFRKVHEETSLKEEDGSKRIRLQEGTAYWRVVFDSAGIDWPGPAGSVCMCGSMRKPIITIIYKRNRERNMPWQYPLAHQAETPPQAGERLANIPLRDQAGIRRETRLGPATSHWESRLRSVEGPKRVKKEKETEGAEELWIMSICNQFELSSGAKVHQGKSKAMFFGNGVERPFIPFIIRTDYRKVLGI